MNMERASLISGAHRKRGVIISNNELVMERLTGYQGYRNSHPHGLGTFVLDAVLDCIMASGILITITKD